MFKLKRNTLRESGGFTLIELMVVILILGILATVGTANYVRLTKRAKAVKAVSEMDAILGAAISYLAQHQEWPEDRNRGIIPPGMSPHLPKDFTFRHDEYILNYDRWKGSSRFEIGITLITNDRNFGRTVMSMTSDASWERHPKYTRVFARAGSAP